MGLDARARAAWGPTEVDDVMRVLDLFSGIGTISLGLESTGAFETVGFCEMDPFCRAVLEKHWPGVPIHDDIKTLSTTRTVDLVCGGFPCQDCSVAGKGAGLKGARSGLWFEMLRVVREVRPRWVLVENVPALRTRGADDVLGGLAEAGYTCWPLVVGAWAVGAPHRRDRVWIVGRLADYTSIGRKGQRMRWQEDGQPCPDGEAMAHGDSGRCGEQRHAEPESKLPSRHLSDGCNSPRREPLGEPSGSGLEEPATLARADSATQSPAERAGLDDAESTRLRDTSQADQRSREQGEGQRDHRTFGLPGRWPARRGQPQHDWESPRATTRAATISRLGLESHGSAYRLAGYWRRQALKACGNATVPQISAAIGRVIARMDRE